MRLHIISRDIQPRDAVGNFCRQMATLLETRGHDVRLAAENCPADERGFIRPIPIALLDIAPQDVVIFHFSTFDPSLPAIARLGTRKLLYFHNITPERFFPGTATTNLVQDAFKQRAFAGQFDRLMANSQVSADVLYEGLSEPDRRRIARCEIVVCPPIIDIDRRASLAAEPVSLPELTRFVLCVGRLVPHKGVHDLLDGFALLAADDPDIGLLIVGQPTDRAYLDRLQARIGNYDAAIAGRVVILHDLPDTALRFLYDRASICASMSEHEGFCVPLVDAMVFDKPIVMRAEPAMLEVAGDTAITVQDASAHKIAAALRAALDPAMAKRLVRARKERLAALRTLADGRCILDAVATLSGRPDASARIAG